MSGAPTVPGVIVCFDAVCLTWMSLLGLVLPALLAVIYLPRVVREATIDDYLLLVFATIFTFASRKVLDGGVSHSPWMLYIAFLWALLACTSDRVAGLRSIPLVGVMVFVSLAIPDIFSANLERPEGLIAVPGGMGLLDGLVLKPAAAIGVTWLAYMHKLRPLFPSKHMRGKAYSAESRHYLINLRPAYRRPASMDAHLELVAVPSAQSSPAHNKRMT